MIEPMSFLVLMILACDGLIEMCRHLDRRYRKAFDNLLQKPGLNAGLFRSCRSSNARHLQCFVISHVQARTFRASERRASMDIDENAPGNISQAGVTNTTDNETGHDPKGKEPEAPLPADDEAPIDDDMTDVDANNSVSNEHPEAGKSGRVGDPDADPQMNDQGEDDKEPRGLPASDPESGA